MKHLFMLIFLLLLQPYDSYAQDTLQRLTVTQTTSEARGTVFRDHPDKAGIIIESPLTNLRFSSNMNGIVEERHQPEQGRYVLIIEPFTQIIAIDAPGFMQERLRIGSPAPRDIRHYVVEPEESGTDLISVIFNVSPIDAQLFVEDQQMEINNTIQIEPGSQNIRLEREGFRSIEDIINVSPANISFSYELEEIDIVAINMSANVPGARIFIDGTERGMFDNTGNFGLFLFPGNYALSIQSDGYLTENTTLNIDEDQENRFNFELTRNIGELSISLTPADASIRLDVRDYGSQTEIELTPGTYALEVSKNGYLPFTETITVSLSETVSRSIDLTRNAGTIKLDIDPPDALVHFNREQVNALDNIELAPGRYRVDIEAEGYDPHSETIEIELGDFIEKNISLNAQFGELRVVVSPGNANVRLMDINNELITEWRGVNVVRNLQVGHYVLKTEADGYRTDKQAIEIAKDQIVALRIELIEGLPCEMLQDIDGNEYPAVQIGNQCWMAENLRTSRYRDGSRISEFLERVSSNSLHQGMRTYYDFDPINNEIYGKLYNWYAVNDERNLCPQGWHVPSHQDWTELMNYLGGLSIAGGKLKVTGSNFWRSPNENATNESGFSALPGGYYKPRSALNFATKNHHGHWWSSTSSSADEAWLISLGHSNSVFLRLQNPKVDGLSVRCIMDD